MKRFGGTKLDVSELWGLLASREQCWLVLGMCLAGEFFSLCAVIGKERWGIGADRG
jgi:hypothetical protein